MRTWKETFILVCIIFFAGCSQQDEQATHENGKAGEVSYITSALGEGFSGFPWVTDIEIVDLDQDGKRDILFTEGKLNQLVWLRNTGELTFEERMIETSVVGPAAIKVVDLEGDGDLDIALGGMGIITPSDQKLGSFAILENDGNQSFAETVILEGVARTNRITCGDLDQDGRVDFVLAMFGYFEGETRILFNKGDMKFESVNLSKLEGAIDAPIEDFDHDGDLDIAVLISQDWEEIHFFENDGSGNFSQRILWGALNKDYGSSGMVATDLDQNGTLDLVFTNGDGFDYATPGSRPWHGVQWLSNDGKGNFEFHRIGDQLGSYSPIVLDVDDDGDKDVVVACAFNDWSNPDADALVCFLNNGEEAFERVSIAKSPTHLIVLEEGDLSGDGQSELVTGALHFYPPYDQLSRVNLWRKGQ